MGAFITISWPDGFANAPVGVSPQYPNLLNGYAKIPQWHVAGVHYGVGITQSYVGSLLDATTTATLPPGCTLDQGNKLVRCANQTSRTIDGYDFSGNGGYTLYNDNSTGTVVTNCLFTVGTNNVVPIQHTSTSTNLITRYCKFDGQNTTSGGAVALVNFIGGGNIIFEYNYCLNIPNDGIDINTVTTVPTVRYNLFYGYGSNTAGEHGDPFQCGNDCVVNNPTVAFNTIYQPSGGLNGNNGDQGIQFQAQSAGGSNPGGAISFGSINNNTVIAPGPLQSMSYCIAIIQNANSGSAVNKINNVWCTDNYIDPTGTIAGNVTGAFYPGASGGPFYLGPVYRNNINMVTGSAITNNP